jgi:2-amino-4-hydroxy-6-hydroxymethyldihydropteridine diphosphokinase
MRFERWAPVYERIRAEFGYQWPKELESARALRALLVGSAPGAIQAGLGQRLRGRDAVVVGRAPGAGPPPIWRLPARSVAPALLAADGAAAPCLDAALVPDVVVTDLDGPVPSEVAASARGAVLVVHAHGDNRAAIERWVPEFHGPVLGSWAGPPDPPLIDPGGFTDGDRAAYLAEAFGAARILLWGFDLHRAAADVPDPARKLAKLRWAGVALELLASEAPGRLFEWQRDGRIEPYGSGRAEAPSTHATDSP